jgi:hypothetical protein
MERRRAAALIGAIALCLALALGGQAMADSLVPEASGADTGRAVGRAASSYLAGIRTFAAAALWNRLDVLSHGYYENVGLTEQRYILSTIAVVQELDPSAVQSFYIGSWILVRNDRVAEGLAMAERGVERNPDAGILRTSLAQLRMLYEDDLDGAAEIGQTVLARAEEMVWLDAEEEYAGYAILRAIFEKAGRDDLVAPVEAELRRIDAGIDEAGGDHDHDGDGVPDH